MSGSYTLLDNVGVTGSAVTLGFGGRFFYELSGTFGGTTVTLQMLGPDGSTYATVKNVAGSAVSDTAADVDTVDLPAGAVIRCTVTGGTPSGLRARLRFVS